MMTGQRIGYKRVSTIEQSTERQLDGIAVDRMFEDKASGKDTHRPQLQAALTYVRSGDLLLIHSMDRLARNVQDLLRIVTEITSRGVAVEFVKERLTFDGSDSPMSLLMLTIMGAVAQFERAMILERQREGIAVAKRQGRYKGQPGTSKLKPEQIEGFRRKLRDKVPISELGRQYGVNRATVYNWIRQHEPEWEGLGRKVGRQRLSHVN